MNGFFNRILKIDVTRHTSAVEDIPDELCRRGLGGKGLGTKLLLENNPAGADPLGPENHIVFATGPVTGSNIPGSSRYGVFARSPQTGFYAESYSGGRAPEALSRTGFDAILISGAADEPVVVEINEDGAVFHPAGDLWGLDTYETEAACRARWGGAYGPSARAGVVSIGPAGENLIRFACLENDKWRSAGRTGLGAVLGSKRIKALVFNGRCRRLLADPGGAAEFVRRIKERAKSDQAALTFRKFGTTGMVAALNKIGAFPSRYWSQGTCDHWEQISGPALLERCDVKPRACLRCPIACGRLSTVKSGRHAGLTVEGPEYETIFAFGGLCMIESIEEITYLNDICDRLGLDTITSGNLCAFAIEASRRGRIKERLDYNQPDQTADLLRRIAYREGVGEVLGRGILAAAAEWGLEDIAMHAKGLEPAGYEPRVLKGMGLAYSVSDRGACHLRSNFYRLEMNGTCPPEQEEGKAGHFINFEDRLTLFDTLILCRFFREIYPWETVSELLECTTGLSLDLEGLRAMAATVTDDTRRFNLREGLTPDDDNLSPGFYRQPLETGETIDEGYVNRLRDDYYRVRGWDSLGRPADE